MSIKFAWFALHGYITLHLLRKQLLVQIKRKRYTMIFIVDFCAVFYQLCSSKTSVRNIIIAQRRHGKQSTSRSISVVILSISNLNLGGFMPKCSSVKEYNYGK